MGKILWPNGTTERPVISSAFGPRNLANPLASTNHRGVDMVGFPTVHAVADGLVVFVGWYSAVGWSPIAGFMVWVQHDGFFTRSLHTDPDTVRVRKGDRVKAGDPLVDKGWSGLEHSWDEHLHLEVTPGNWHTSNYGQVDPIGFIQARLTTGAPANVPTSDPEEDDMPLNEDDIQKIARAVWNYQIGENGNKGRNNLPAWKRLGRAEWFARIGASVAEWVKSRLGGSVNDEPVGNVVAWLKARIGGSVKGESVDAKLDDLGKD